jgi:hypothetical protein
MSHARCGHVEMLLAFRCNLAQGDTSFPNKRLGLLYIELVGAKRGAAHLLCTQQLVGLRPNKVRYSYIFRFFSVVSFSFFSTVSFLYFLFYF